MGRVGWIPSELGQTHKTKMSFAVSHIASYLGEQHKRREETGDYELRCQGRVIKAHSFILSMRSKFFETAMNTAVGNNNKAMEVEEFSYEVLSAAVDFMYGIEIPEEFNKVEDLKSLLRMADLYLMEDLKDAAGFLISKTLNKENICDISLFADKFRAMLLSEQCANFLFDNHSSVEDEKLAEMKEGTVMAALAMKMLKETKRVSWVTKLFGDNPDFKWRKDFGSLDQYKNYVRSQIKPKMIVRSNGSTRSNGRNWYNWKTGGSYYNVTEGHIGVALSCMDTDGRVQVKWLTLVSGVDVASPLLNQVSCGPIECLDLLTLPVTIQINI